MPVYRRIKGIEVAYVENTSPVNATVVAEASAPTLVTDVARTYDGGVYLFEFYAPYGLPGITAGHYYQVMLFDGATSLGFTWLHMAANTNTPAQGYVGINIQKRLTPSGGVHTYSWRAIGVGSTGVIGAGVGGAAAYSPMFMRTTTT